MQINNVISDPCFFYFVLLYIYLTFIISLMFISVYDPNHQLFILNFRGLSFSFPIDSKFEVCYLHAIARVWPGVLILLTGGRGQLDFYTVLQQQQH